jgi:hypothetical protein
LEGSNWTLVTKLLILIDSSCEIDDHYVTLRKTHFCDLGTNETIHQGKKHLTAQSSNCKISVHILMVLWMLWYSIYDEISFQQMIYFLHIDKFEYQSDNFNSRLKSWVLEKLYSHTYHYYYFWINGNRQVMVLHTTIVWWYQQFKQKSNMQGCKWSFKMFFYQHWSTSC